ncbi:hypothetical protein C2845_PM02G17940 [Panicum miliaceum]|uniref:Uncharacterized protein n=1 Tax=Panicum miliaceum TaxID=4540 RepID=A0A3L6S946_PANMI|nr:hypothetical protein C2845_PM02G17940 [Panicum miliaceum]
MANPALGIPPRTGYAPKYKASWEELPTAKEMEQVEALLGDLSKLKAAKLTGSAMALFFCKRLTQSIQSWVHPGYEYWGRADST